MRVDQISIDRYLFESLKALSFQEFTVIQVRDIYLDKVTISLSPNETRKYVYRQLTRLIKHGLLVKKQAKNAQKSTYSATKRLKTTQLKLKTPIHQRLTTDLVNENKVLNSRTPPLQEQLRQYQVDLLSSIGESEEYKRLYTSNPKLKRILESKYHKARDHSSKLLGQIKAIKNVISHLSE